jgi:tetratricopeptide (TPR) repeat protein
MFYQGGIMNRWMLFVLALALLPAFAHAQPQEGLSFDGVLAEGHALYLAGDYEGALAKYQEAKEQESGNALAYYFVGCAFSALDKTEDAISALNTSATIAGEKDQSLHAKALFMVAVLRERSADWDAAKEAWTKYQGFAQTHSDATTFVPIAQERLDAIEKRVKLDADYQVVRDRIKAVGEAK